MMPLGGELVRGQIRRQSPDYRERREPRSSKPAQNKVIQIPRANLAGKPAQDKTTCILREPLAGKAGETMFCVPSPECRGIRPYRAGLCFLPGTWDTIGF